MAANAEIFFEHGDWKGPLAWSAGLHVAVTGLIILYAIWSPGRGTGLWGAGGGGDAIGVNLVTTIPLPSTRAEKENVLATESKGLSQSQPKIEETAPEAVPIPDKNAK